MIQFIPPIRPRHRTSPNHKALILLNLNGEPGGARTRDHRIKSANRPHLGTPPCPVFSNLDAYDKPPKATKRQKSCKVRCKVRVAFHLHGPGAVQTRSGPSSAPSIGMTNFSIAAPTDCSVGRSSPERFPKAFHCVCLFSSSRKPSENATGVAAGIGVRRRSKV